MQMKTVQTGYILGISLLITSIVYFFASNWQYFDRFTKLGLCMGLLLGFYLLHYAFKKVFHLQSFLSNWMLVSACILFGICIALIGQIYNSHADHYQLFLIWMIPALLISLLTKYTPFYIITYVLAHLSMFFFLSPATYFPEWSGTELMLMLYGITGINAVLFYVCFTRIKSKTIYYISFIMFHSMFYFIVVNDSLSLYNISNLLFVVILTVQIYFWSKIRSNQPMLVITGIFTGLYFLTKIFTWIFDHYGYWTLFILLALACCMVMLSIVTIAFINKSKLKPFLTNFITIIITVIATLFAAVAISGLFFLFLPDATSTALFFFAVILLIIPGLFLKMPDQIRYTLLGTGFLLSTGSQLFTSQMMYMYILLLLLCIGFYVVKMAGIRVLIYFFINIVAFQIVLDLTDYKTVFLIMAILNGIYYAIAAAKHSAAKNMALIFGYLYFISLTVIDVAVWLQVIYNAAFFITTTAVLIGIKRENRKWEWTASLIFWFLFLSYKYYEYLWTLIHKSVLFLVLGLLFIGISFYMDRKKGLANSGKLLSYRSSLMLLVIALQFGIIGYQITASEYLLKEGKLVKLEIEPVDPHSLLQGDYIQLHYSISDLGEDISEPLHGKKIQIVLREKDGIFQYGGFYKANNAWNQPYTKQENDVIINGTAYSTSNITYGIETFFIPDGTGSEVENEADYAIIKVGKGGDAILEKLE